MGFFGFVLFVCFIQQNQAEQEQEDIVGWVTWSYEGEDSSLDIDSLPMPSSCFLLVS